MGIGIKELVVILIIVLLLFGTKRLKSLGTDLGGAIKGFRKSMQDEETEQPPLPAAEAQKPLQRESMQQESLQQEPGREPAASDTTPKP